MSVPRGSESPLRNVDSHLTGTVRDAVNRGTNYLRSAIGEIVGRAVELVVPERTVWMERILAGWITLGGLWIFVVPGPAFSDATTLHYWPEWFPGALFLIYGLAWMRELRGKPKVTRTPKNLRHCQLFPFGATFFWLTYACGYAMEPPLEFATLMSMGWAAMSFVVWARLYLRYGPD